MKKNNFAKPKGEKSPLFKHGETSSKGASSLYSVWSHMLQRCNNPKCRGYKYYGGRGITVCSEWSESTIFISWAYKNGYKKGLEIDRIDNNGNYEPSNCRWTTRSINNFNRRKSPDFGIHHMGKGYQVKLQKDNIMYYAGFVGTIEEARIIRDRLISDLYTERKGPIKWEQIWI